MCTYVCIKYFSHDTAVVLYNCICFARVTEKNIGNLRINKRKKKKYVHSVGDFLIPLSIHGIHFYRFFFHY